MSDGGVEAAGQQPIVPSGREVLADRQVRNFLLSSVVLSTGVALQLAVLGKEVFDITGRESGFKPSEMFQRLLRAGLADDGTLAVRVVQRLAALEKENILRRREKDNRYEATFTPADLVNNMEDNLPF